VQGLRLKFRVQSEAESEMIDLVPFSKIIPFGMSDYSVTSVAKLLNGGIGSFREAGPLDMKGFKVQGSRSN
jgi:hypothetical protein